MLNSRLIRISTSESEDDDDAKTEILSDSADSNSASKSVFNLFQGEQSEKSIENHQNTIPAPSPTKQSTFGSMQVDNSFTSVPSAPSQNNNNGVKPLTLSDLLNVNSESDNIRLIHIIRKNNENNITLNSAPVRLSTTAEESIFSRSFSSPVGTSSFSSAAGTSFSSTAGTSFRSAARTSFCSTTASAKKPELVIINSDEDSEDSDSADIKPESVKKEKSILDFMPTSTKTEQTNPPANKRLKVGVDLKLEEEAQEVSFHKINLNKFPLDWPEESMINAIINKYNEPGKQHKRYEEEFVSFQPRLDENDAHLFEGDNFIVKIFVQAVAEPIIPLTVYGINRSKQLIHQIIFHYRKNEIFALTTGSGWNVVQWCSDFDFPGKFAARFLSENGLLESCKKGIVGNESTHRRTHKNEQEANPFDLLEFCTTYTAELRNNASILSLSCFQSKKMQIKNYNLKSNNDDGNKNTINDPSSLLGFPNATTNIVGPNPNLLMNAIKRVKVVVSISAIRMRKPFHPIDFLGILSFMSTISRGEKTLDLDGATEQNSTAHLKYISIVHNEIGSELDLIISKIFREAISNDEKMGVLDDFDFSHKYYSNFSNGYDYELSYKKKIVETWGTRPPTWRQIILSLRTTTLYTLAPSSLCSDEDFLKYLGDFKMSYDVRGPFLRRPERLFNYLEGFFYRKEESRIYWHVHSNWCYVREVYLVLVNSEFTTVLKSNLKKIQEDDIKAYDKLGWLLQNEFSSIDLVEELTNQYVEIHKKIDDFFVPHITSHQDLFDMLRLCEINGQSSFRIYFVVPTFDHRSLSKGLQITNSLLQIKKAALSNSGKKNAVGGIERIRKKLKLIHDQVIRNPKFKNACSDFKRFLEMLSEAEVCLTVGRAAVKSIGFVRSLEEESQIPTKLTTLFIRKKFQELIQKGYDDDAVNVKKLGNIFQADVCLDDCKSLSDSLHLSLTQQDFIDSTFSVTGKLLGQTKYSFDLKVEDMNSTLRQFVFNSIILPFQSQSSSFLAKLAIIRAHRELQGYGYKTFDIMELLVKLAI